MRNTQWISHVADYCNRYPGELIHLSTRLQWPTGVAKLTVRVVLPYQLHVEQWESNNVDLPAPLQLIVTQTPTATGKPPLPEQYVEWRDLQEPTDTSILQFDLRVRVQAVEQDCVLESTAVCVIQEMQSNHALLPDDAETVRLSIQTQARIMRYLPALYEKDKLMRRYLMFFEHHWQPIDARIENIADYLDTAVMPPRLLPWLASWYDVALDSAWPEASARRLLKTLFLLHRKRGTKVALQEYLSAFTGWPAQIQEFGANQFQLGPSTKLGMGIAFGSQTQPHAFTVRVRLPSQADPTQQELYKQIIAAIIEREKPAHTKCLHIDYLA